jgi:hypothetical protein
MDNFFTSITLFSELYICEFGAIEIIRLYKKFPEKLKELKDRFLTKLE